MLTVAQLAGLRSIPTPTVANAIETFSVRPRGDGVTDAGVRCFFPQHGAVVGYACTATILSNQPAAAKRRVSRTDYWEYTRSLPAPKITVVQDLSEEPGGAYWGEVNTNIHKALGSQGVLTNGTVRDLEEVERSGFHVFARGVSVSHGLAHLEDFNRPVKVFGMTVHPGDLIHADRHGAVVIPHEIAGEVAGAARRIEAQERIILSLCEPAAFSIAELDKLVSPDY